MLNTHCAFNFLVISECIIQYPANDGTDISGVVYFALGKEKTTGADLWFERHLKMLIRYSDLQEARYSIGGIRF